MNKRVTDDILNDDVDPPQDDVATHVAADDGPEEEDLEVEEPEDDADADPEQDDAEVDPEPEPIAARQPTRGQRQHANLRARAQQAERDAEEAKRRARELEAQLAQQSQRRNPMESPEVRQARLAAMDPQERTEFLINEIRAENAHDRQMQAFTAADSADKAAYDAMSRVNPSYKKYAAEVEHRLRMVRQQGQNVPRETILKFLLGEKVIEARASGRPNPKRDEASARVRKQAATPTRSRGDSGSGGKEADSVARMRRLENLQI